MANSIESRATTPISKIDLSLARKNLNDAQRAIASINYSDVWKHVGMVIKCGNVRIDTQKPQVGQGISVQMRVNDKNAQGGECVANIHIDEAVRQYAGGSDAQIKKLIRQVVKSALLKSMNTGWQFQVRDMAPPSQ